MDVNEVAAHVTDHLHDQANVATNEAAILVWCGADDDAVDDGDAVDHVEVREEDRNGGSSTGKGHRQG